MILVWKLELGDAELKSFSDKTGINLLLHLMHWEKRRQLKRKHLFFFKFAWGSFFSAYSELELIWYNIYVSHRSQISNAKNASSTVDKVINLNASLESYIPQAENSTLKVIEEHSPWSRLATAPPSSSNTDPPTAASCVEEIRMWHNSGDKNLSPRPRKGSSFSWFRVRMLDSGWKIIGRPPEVHEALAVGCKKNSWTISNITIGSNLKPWGVWQSWSTPWPLLD